MINFVLRSFVVMKIVRAAWQTCIVAWDFGASWALVVWPKETTEEIDRFCRTHDIPDTLCLIASNPAFKYAKPSDRSYVASYFLVKRLDVFKMFSVSSVGWMILRDVNERRLKINKKSRDISNANWSYLKRFVIHLQSVQKFCWYVFLVSLFLLPLHFVQHRE